MNEKNILKHLSKSIDQAPIQMLETIKDNPRVKQLRHDEITSQKSGSTSMKFITVVASIFILVAMFNFQFQYRAVDSRVYLDINPSIVIESNRQNKVIAISALNPEGDKLIEGYKFKGRALNQVIIDLVDMLVLSEYISESDDLMLVSVFNDNNEKANLQKNELKTVILNHLESKNIQPVILAQAIDNNNTTTDMVVDYNLSEGKLVLIRNLMIHSPKLKADVLAKLPLDELVGIAKYIELDLSLMIEKQELDRIVVPDTIKDIIEKDVDSDDNNDANGDTKDDTKDDDSKADDSNNESKDNESKVNESKDNEPKDKNPESEEDSHENLYDDSNDDNQGGNQ